MTKVADIVKRLREDFPEEIASEGDQLECKLDRWMLKLLK